MPETSSPRPLTPPEIARKLGISPEKVRRWIDAGELRALDTSPSADGPRSRYVVYPADLQRFIDRRFVGPRELAAS